MPFNFLQLPGEIRNEIYAYLLPTPDDPKLAFLGFQHAIQFVWQPSALTRKFLAERSRRVFHGMHLACRQTHAELPTIRDLLEAGAVVPTVNLYHTSWETIFREHSDNIRWILRSASRLRFRTGYWTAGNPIETSSNVGSRVPPWAKYDTCERTVCPLQEERWADFRGLFLQPPGTRNGKVIQWQEFPMLKDFTPVIQLLHPFNKSLHNLDKIEILPVAKRGPHAAKEKLLSKMLELIKRLLPVLKRQKYVWIACVDTAWQSGVLVCFEADTRLFTSLQDIEDFEAEQQALRRRIKAEEEARARQNEVSIFDRICVQM